MEFNFEELMKTIGDEITMRSDMNALMQVAAKQGRRITQRDFAAAVGCSEGMISKWLRGERMLGMKFRINMYNHLRQLEKELGVEKEAE